MMKMLKEQEVEDLLELDIILVEGDQTDLVLPTQISIGMPAPFMSHLMYGYKLLHFGLHQRKSNSFSSTLFFVTAFQIILLTATLVTNLR